MDLFPPSLLFAFSYMRHIEKHKWKPKSSAKIHILGTKKKLKNT